MLPEPSDAGDESIVPPSAVVLTTPSVPDEIEPAQAAAATVSPATGADTAVAPVPEPATVGLAPAARPAEPLVEKSPLDGLRIASQSWQRGGLGSKVLVTLTLRNRNDFAVKDIEIACAFVRRDGSLMTERKRLLADPIAMRSRKTYPPLLVGFVNVNADKAKCSLITASRL